jgi:hypothetical protein
VKTYQFDVVLKDVAEISDEDADKLYAAGCDDGTPASCNGAAWIHFDRESRSLEEAIQSAIIQVRSAGFKVSKVELDADAGVSLGV